MPTFEQQIPSVLLMFILFVTKYILSCIVLFVHQILDNILETTIYQTSISFLVQRDKQKGDQEVWTIEHTKRGFAMSEIGNSTHKTWTQITKHRSPGLLQT